jgi:CoA:oxalate CoA-transferase
MALAGARVIKIEPPAGENLRGRTQGSGAGAPFVMLNSNKEGITLNLRSAAGKETFLAMCEKADVVVENFRPGVTDRLGIGPAAARGRNPRLIYASSSGYGSTGPYRDLAAMDLTVQAMSGVMSITGYPDRPPVKAGPALADFFAGVHLFGAITTALYAREKSGVGSTVETSMIEAIYPTLMSSLGLLFGPGTEVPTRTGNRHSGLAEAPYNVYATSDGYVAIICVTDAHWRAMAEFMGAPELADDPKFATRRARVENIEEIDKSVGDFVGGYLRDDIIDALRAHAVPCAPVRDLPEVVQDEHLHARGMLQQMDHPSFGPLTVHHSPLHFEGERLPLRPSPELGQDTEAVLKGWLGLSDAEFDRLIVDQENSAT